MAFQDKTLEIIKNFASINQGLVFKPGNRLRTSSVLKNILASATIPDEIPKEFAIYDLNAFLSVLSLYDDPQITFNDNHFLISSGKSKIKYFYSNPAVVVQPPAKDLEFTDLKATFVLTAASWQQIQKAASVLKLEKLSIHNGGLRATGSNDNPNTYDVDVEVDGDVGAPVFVKIENVRLLPGDYNVEVYGRAVKFNSTTEEGLSYLVSLESE